MWVQSMSTIQWIRIEWNGMNWTQLNRNEVNWLDSRWEKRVICHSQLGINVLHRQSLVIEMLFIPSGMLTLRVLHFELGHVVQRWRNVKNYLGYTYETKFHLQLYKYIILKILKHNCSIGSVKGTAELTNINLYERWRALSCQTADNKIIDPSEI